MYTYSCYTQRQHFFSLPNRVIMIKCTCSEGLFRRGSKGEGPTKWAILLAKWCKLDQRPLDEGPRPRRGKARCLLHDINLDGNTKLNGSNQEVKLMFWRSVLKSRVQGKICPVQEFNLPQLVLVGPIWALEEYILTMNIVTTRCIIIYDLSWHEDVVTTHCMPCYTLSCVHSSNLPYNTKIMNSTKFTNSKVFYISI